MFKELSGSRFGGASAADLRNVTMRVAHALEGEGRLDDVRSKSARGRAANAGTVPLDRLERNLARFDREKPVDVICRSGVRSQRGATIWAGNGLAEVYHVAGGAGARTTEKLPSEK